MCYEKTTYGWWWCGVRLHNNFGQSLFGVSQAPLDACKSLHSCQPCMAFPAKGKSKTPKEKGALTHRSKEYHHKSHTKIKICFSLVGFTIHTHSIIIIC